jgi:hypothetical protein
MRAVAPVRNEGCDDERVHVEWDLTSNMSGGPKGAKRPLRRPLDGGVSRQTCLAVRADPEPMNATRDREAKGPVVEADAHAVEATAA